MVRRSFVCGQACSERVACQLRSRRAGHEIGQLSPRRPCEIVGRGAVSNLENECHDDVAPARYTVLS